MNDISTIQESRLISEIRRYADSIEHLLNLDSNINESTVKLSPILITRMSEYESILLVDQSLCNLDREKFRIGLDPFNEWLSTNYESALIIYDNLNEGVWDSLKSAGSWVGDKAMALGDTIGSSIKAAGSAALNATPWGKKIITLLKALTEGGSAIGVFQLLLDIIGLIPASFIGIPIDTAADFLNAIIYFKRGMTVNGIISIIAAMPMGDFIKGLKLTAAKPLAKLGEIVSGVGAKNSVKAQQAAAALVKMEGGSSLLTKLASPIKGLYNGVKSIISSIVKFLSKFVPASWSAKMETWLVRNIDAPIKATQESLELATNFMKTKSFTKLAKADAEAGTNYASRLSKNVGETGATNLGVNVGGKYTVKTSATVINDAAMQAVKKHGYVNPKLIDSIVSAGPADVKRLFQSIETSKAFSKMEPNVQKVVQGIIKNPDIFIKANTRAKNLNKSLDAIMALAKTSKKRKSIKVATFLALMIRNYCKTQEACISMYVKNALNLANKYKSFVNEAQEFNADDITINPDVSQTVPTTDTVEVSQPAEVPPIDETTNEEHKPCESVENQIKTVQAAEFLRAFTPMPGKPFGGTAPDGDAQIDAQLEFQNQYLIGIGAEPIYATASSKYPVNPIEERVKFVEVLDEETMKFNIARDKEEEEQRYANFIEVEVKKGEYTREQITEIVRKQREANKKLDGDLESNTSSIAPTTQAPQIFSTPKVDSPKNESFKLKDFKNFIK